MIMAVSRTWYVLCSPRNPEKIALELRELARLDGVNWRERNEKKQLVHQITFAHLLKQLESFEGSISASEPALSARDRLAPMQTYGFAFVDSAHTLRITNAGHRLIDGMRVQELFLKQTLKWQYPSWQHGGNLRTRRRYLHADQMDIHPFVETLRVCRELAGLSKEEIAIFLLPVLNRGEISAVIQIIKDFRAELSKRHGRHRKEFIRGEQEEHFRQVYAHEIASKDIGTRESRTATVDSFLKNKMKNSRDVADAAIRYFRSTGLFTLSADFHGLTISPIHRNEVDCILDEMTFAPVNFYDDVDRFYKHMGNPDLPALAWETRNQLVAKAIALGLQKHEAQQLSLPALKDTIEQHERERKTEKLIEFMANVQEEAEVQDIVEMFKRILNRDVVDPALFLEWNIWRAIASMDDCREARPNFTLDDDLQPFSNAPGKRADMEIEYNDSFVTLVEVTLSSGARQYDTESEPVTRHIGRFQFEEKKRAKPRAVYGLFVAKSINPAARDYFYVHLKHIANPDFGGYLNIIPLNIDQFVDIFQFCKSLPNFHRGVIRDLFDRVIALKDSTNNGEEWGKQIPAAIEAWKHYWQQ